MFAEADTSGDGAVDLVEWTAWAAGKVPKLGMCAIDDLEEGGKDDDKASETEFVSYFTIDE